MDDSDGWLDGDLKKSFYSISYFYIVDLLRKNYGNYSPSEWCPGFRIVVVQTLVIGEWVGKYAASVVIMTCNCNIPMIRICQIDIGNLKTRNFTKLVQVRNFYSPF